MAEDKLILREKCKDMMKYAYNAIKDIPRDYRYTLGVDIRDSMIRLFNLIIRCGKKYYKKTTLQDMDIEHSVLKGLIQVAVENKVITKKEYEVLSRHLTELGRLIGGWIKKAKQ